MKKGKKIYFGLLLIIVFLISTMYFSYAFFTNKNEEHGKLNIVAGTLDYKIESNDLEGNQITVLANEIEKLELSITSLNEISSKYELYYNTSDSTDIEIGYSIDSIDKVSGEIESNAKKKVTVIIKNNSDSDKEISFGVQGGLANNVLELTEGKSLDNEINLCNYEAGEVFTFDYTGDSQLFTTFCEGNYQIELWGASGGDYEDNLGGQGGYTKGTIYLDQAENFYLYVGSQPTDYNGGYNGGGKGGSGTDGSYTGGGGATDIRLNRGEWNLFDSLKSRLMVSGAGAGTGMYYSNVIAGGAAGGLDGHIGEISSCSDEKYELYGHTVATAGTQTSGGLGINGGTYRKGYFGYATTGSFTLGTGGGSGYYGGGSGSSSNCNVSSGAGGSSFISGHDGCDAITEDSTEDNITHTGQSNHYSNYVFYDTIMIDGAGYNWTTEKGTEIVGMPTHDGTSTMTGNSGNGYAKITYLGKSNIDELLEYNLESDDLENNQITVAANTMKKITVDVNSLSKVSSNYEIYYTTDDTTDLTIGYGDENNETTGVIGTSSTKTVNIYIRNTSTESKSLTFNVKGSLNSIELDETAKEISNLCTENTIYNFDYIGDSENFITPCNGNYKVELWGAGYDYYYKTTDTQMESFGSYTSGILTLSNENLFLYLGEQGTRKATAELVYSDIFNGGGEGSFTCLDIDGQNGSNDSGGGATDIRLVAGDWDDFESLKSRLMVAGGSGAFGFIHANPSPGGGLYSEKAGYYDLEEYAGTGAGQTYAGQINGAFGIGGDAEYGGATCYYNNGGGGGGGYYGGGGSSTGNTKKQAAAGAGGSSFISGHDGCDAITEDSTEDNIVHTGQSIHYSNYSFTDTVMIDGAGYNWTTEKGSEVVGMPTHDGTSIMTGNSGNGYAKITYLGN